MTRRMTEAPAPLVPAPAPGRAMVVAQLGQTLDGRIATVTGASKYINGTAALDHLHALRAGVDAVVVGVGTVVADDPRLTVRRCPGRSPRRVVIDPTGRMPRDACMLSDRTDDGSGDVTGDGGAPVLVVTGPGAPVPPGAEALELPVRDGRIDPAAIVAALVRRGMQRILVEGGAETISRFIDARAVDLLHVLMAPMILGSGKPGLSCTPIDGLDEALRPRTAIHLFDDGDVLFVCDLRAGAAS